MNPQNQFGSSQPLIPSSQLNDYFTDLLHNISSDETAQGNAMPQGAESNSTSTSTLTKKRKRDTDATNSTNSKRKKTTADSITPLITDTNSLLQQQISRTFLQLRSLSKLEISVLRFQQKLELVKMIRVFFILGNVQTMGSTLGMSQKSDNEEEPSPQNLQFLEASKYLWYLLQKNATQHPPLNVTLFGNDSILYQVPQLEKFPPDINLFSVSLKALRYFLETKDFEEALDLIHVILVLICMEAPTTAGRKNQSLWWEDNSPHLSLIYQLVDRMMHALSMHKSLTPSKKKFSFRLLIQILSQILEISQIEKQILDHEHFPFTDDKDRADFLVILGDLCHVDGGQTLSDSTSTTAEDLQRRSMKQLKQRDQIYARALNLYAKKQYYLRETVDVLCKMSSPPNLLSARVLNTLEGMTQRMKNLFKNDAENMDSRYGEDDDPISDQEEPQEKRQSKPAASEKRSKSTPEERAKDTTTVVEEEEPAVHSAAEQGSDNKKKTSKKKHTNKQKHSSKKERKKAAADEHESEPQHSSDNNTTTTKTKTTIKKKRKKPFVPPQNIHFQKKPSPSQKRTVPPSPSPEYSSDSSSSSSDNVQHQKRYKPSKKKKKSSKPVAKTSTNVSEQEEDDVSITLDQDSEENLDGVIAPSPSDESDDAFGF